ncbi:MAG TPA: hypothetical protein PK585_00055 [Amphiplicatus sp.]|nr:hypothetical protein [Amphiplicatus sp.]MCB9956136.1 hypothetical protein [Caulobacterales bacterium]HOP18443.1 hypothetical protein [Amphiplicatus sp.]
MDNREFSDRELFERLLSRCNASEHTAAPEALEVAAWLEGKCETEKAGDIERWLAGEPLFRRSLVELTAAEHVALTSRERQQIFDMVAQGDNSFWRKVIAFTFAPTPATALLALSIFLGASLGQTVAMLELERESIALNRVFSGMFF